MFMDLTSGTQANVQQLLPVGGTMSDFTVRASVAPGTGDSYVFTVMDGAAASTLSCTITGTSQTCTTDTDDYVFTAGDLISIQMTEAGEPTASTFHWTASFDT
jgi:hypothetical protein